MNKFLLILLLVIFPFGQFLRWDLGNSIVLHANDIVVGIIGTIGFIRQIRTIKKNPLFTSVAVWVGAMVLSLVVNFGHYSFTQIFVAALYAVRWVAYAGLFFVFKDFNDKSLISKGLKFSVLMIAIAGIAQYIFMPDVSFLAAANWDNHYFRLVSTFLDPGFTGIILVLGLISIFNFQFAILFTALALTYSRAGYLAYLVGFATVAFYKKSLKIIIIAAIVLLAAIYLLPQTFGEGTKLGRENSSWARLESWQEAIGVWQKAPLFGIGFGAYRYAADKPAVSHAGAGSDSSLLTVLATTGVVGLVAYLGVLRGMWVMGKSPLFRASLLAVFIHSWFNNTLFYPWVMEYIWLLLVLDRKFFR